MLIWLDDKGAQKPIYYTDRVLHDAETRYSKLAKIIYILIISAWHIMPYFQTHSIVVLTDQPLKVILHRPDTSRGKAKWAVKLNEFNISYHQGHL